MSQSLANILIHIVFSTKDRFPFLTDKDMLRRMHAYLARTLTEQDCPAIEVGGTADHVHVLCSLSRTHSISDVICKAKAHSSGWVKDFGGLLSKFAWQGGYGAFSLHPAQLMQIRAYIQNQQEHHRVSTFQEEYLKLLHEYQLPFDQRYIWT